MKRHTSLPLLTSLDLVVGIEKPIPEGIAPVLEGGLVLRSAEAEGQSNQLLDSALDMTACLVAAHHRLNGAWTGGQGKDRSELGLRTKDVLNPQRQRLCMINRPKGGREADRLIHQNHFAKLRCPPSPLVNKRFKVGVLEEEQAVDV